MGRRQLLKQSCGLLLHSALAVEIVACMVNKFHRAESVEPAEEPLAESVHA